MIGAYDDYGNVVDLVEWENQIRAKAIDEYKNALLKYRVIDSSVIRRVAEQIKEQKE